MSSSNQMIIKQLQETIPAGEYPSFPKMTGRAARSIQYLGEFVSYVA